MTGFLLSVVSLVIWLTHHPIPRYAPEHAAAHVSADPSSAHGEKTAAAVKHAADAVHASGEAKPAEAAVPAFVSGDWYSLGEFGKLHITIGYYIDALTVAMFCMVTLIASCIHIYSFGYMHEELHDVTDSLVTLSNGQTLRRRGRFHRFLPIPVALLLQHVRIGTIRQRRDGFRLLGTGRHLFLLSDRFLYRAEERVERGEQGVYRQSRRRLRDDHRPDGRLDRHGHFLLRRLSGEGRSGECFDQAGHFLASASRKGRWGESGGSEISTSSARRHGAMVETG